MTTASTSGRQTAAKSGPREEEVIRHRFDEFAAAWNRHDPHAMASLYTDDADLINPSGRAAKSRTEIEKMFKDEHGTQFKDSHMSLRFEDLRLLAPEIVVTDHAFEVSGALDPSGKEITLRGHLTAVLRKLGDTWLMTVCRPMVPVTAPNAR